MWIIGIILSILGVIWPLVINLSKVLINQKIGMKIYKNEAIL